MRIKAAALGVAAAAACTVLIWIVFLRPQQQHITRDALEAARQRWQAARIDNYDLEVQVSGRQPAVYSVQVRGGDVRQATHNGNPIRGQRSQTTWSVPGMFGTIAIDVQTVERFQSGRAERTAQQLLLLGWFDPQNGLPRKYHRIEKVKRGSNRDVTWEVTKFDVVR